MGTLHSPHRHTRTIGIVILALSSSTGACAPEGGREEALQTPEGAVAAIQGEEMRGHLRSLAHDSMRGRAPGDAGGEMAARYIAEEFRASGLEPIEGSWFQAVPILGTTPLPESIRLSFRGTTGTQRPDYLEDFVLWSGDPQAESVQAGGELVFVGYGVSAPENRWEDFGDGVAGKVLLILVNDPPAPDDEPDLFGGRAMTYYGRWTYKYEEAARQEAVGALVIHTTEEAGYPWGVVRSSWSGEQFALPPDAEGTPPVPLQGWLSRETAEAVLGMAGLDLDSLTALAGSRDFAPVPTGIQVEGSLRSRVREVETRNVVGMVPGSERPEEVITITSHYDHLGVGDPVDGDSIYNGAYDNASGIALLLEVADAFGALETRPARSVVFIATAAEEAGLLGAGWYVQQPLFPLGNTVAEINVDGANLWGETNDLIAMGADRSELGAFVERRASEAGVELAPDAEPEKGFFFRSDHFPFARAGVPAVYFEHGRVYRGREEGWGQRIQDEYQAERYHAPADEYTDEFVFEGAVQQARLVFLTAWDLARSREFPEWNEGSEFRAARERQRGEGGSGEGPPGDSREGTGGGSGGGSP